MDPSSFLKNSPYQLNHTDSYNLANTTHELLKFQLLEQARNSPAMMNPPQLSGLMDAFENHSFLQNALFSKDDSGNRSDESLAEEDISCISTPSSDVSGSWKAAADKDPRTYLNLKVLIENSVFDTTKMSQKEVMPLHKVKKLKQQIADKQEHKDYLTERIAVSSQFCSTLLLNSNISEENLDARLLLKILKQTANLQMELMTISQELETLTQKLNSHNMACLVLGYVEDLKISALSAGSRLSNPLTASESPKDSKSLQALESLVSHVASVAAQKSIPLPEFSEIPRDESLQSKILWTTQCIDALALQPVASTDSGSELCDHNIDNSVLRDHSFLSTSPYDAYKNSKGTSNKTISEYKLALNDLRFSHQYFMKEYEYLKENSVKTIQDYRRKNALLEKEIHELKTGSTASLSSTTSRDALESKDKEIAQLRREINEYKIECLGNKSPRSSMNYPPPTPDSGAKETFLLPPKTLGTSMSNAILRKEFKKMVADMQDQYEIELSEERFKRRGLEEKLQKMEAE